MKSLNSACYQKKYLCYGGMFLFVLGISLAHIVLNKTYAQSPLTRMPTLITAPVAIEALLIKARVLGSVNIIVGLKPDGYKPEGNLSGEAAQKQLQSIVDAQNRLLARMSSYGIKSAVKFQYVPGLSMTVDENTLMALSIDPEVITIEESIPVAPALEQGDTLAPSTARPSMISSPATIETLLAAARARGAVMITVGLHLDGYNMVGNLSPEAEKIQLQAIAEVQNRLLARMSAHEITSVVKYKYQPHVAMVVDEATLKALAVDPEVRTIEENIPVPYATTPAS